MAISVLMAYQPKRTVSLCVFAHLAIVRLDRVAITRAETNDQVFVFVERSVHRCRDLRTYRHQLNGVVTYEMEPTPIRQPARPNQSRSSKMTATRYFLAQRPVDAYAAPFKAAHEQAPSLLGVMK